MKTFKLIDVWISLTLITVFVLLDLLPVENSFIMGYFVVGGWQLISMVVHVIAGWFGDKGGLRYRYQWTVLLIILATLLFLAVYPLLLLWLLALLIGAPLMAVWYTLICYQEVYVKMKRPLDSIK